MFSTIVFSTSCALLLLEWLFAADWKIRKTNDLDAPTLNVCIKAVDGNIILHFILQIQVQWNPPGTWIEKELI